MSLFSVSKEISDLIHDSETDYDAPVKVVINVSEGDEREFVVTDVNYEVNLEDGQATVWLSVVEE
jgi:hypothetical protein